MIPTVHATHVHDPPASRVTSVAKVLVQLAPTSIPKMSLSPADAYALAVYGSFRLLEIFPCSVVSIGALACQNVSLPRVPLCCLILSFLYSTPLHGQSFVSGSSPIADSGIIIALIDNDRHAVNVLTTFLFFMLFLQIL